MSLNEAAIGAIQDELGGAGIPPEWLSAITGALDSAGYAVVTKEGATPVVVTQTVPATVKRLEHRANARLVEALVAEGVVERWVEQSGPGGIISVFPLGQKGEQGVTGPEGPGVPAGGSTGQFLTKNSGDDFDTLWAALTFAMVGSTPTTLAGYGITDACGADDARLSDARVPTAHAASHRDGGSDEVATATAAAGAIPKAGPGAELHEAWLPWYIADFSAARKRIRSHALQGTVGRTAVGCSSGSLSGTVTSTAADANGWVQLITSGASSGNQAGGPFIATGSGGDFWAEHSPTLLFRVRTGATTTSYRIVAGFSSNAAFSQSDANSAYHSAYFRYSTGAGDSGWVCVTANGSAATVSSQVAAFAADTAYWLGVRFRGSAVEFWLGTGNDPSTMTLVHTATSTLPANSTTLNTYAAATTLTNAARTMSYYHLDVSCL